MVKTCEELLKENRRLLQIEAKYVRLEKLLIDYFIKYNEFYIETEDFKKHVEELLK